MNLRVWPSRVLAAGASIFSTVCLAQSPMFTVKVLDTLPGATATGAGGINNAGEIVGAISGSTACPTVCAVVWQNGVPTPLGVVENASEYTALAINNAGQVAGTAKINLVGIGDQAQAVVWNNGVPTLLPAPDSVHTITFAYGISDAGEVVGGALQPATFLSTGAVPVVWNGTSPTTLGLPAGSTTAYATGANISGLVIGWSQEATDQPIVWHGTTPTLLPGFGEPFAVNNSGLVVGIGMGHALAWANKAIITLETISSSAVSVNNRGIIVGWWQKQPQTRAALWTKVGAATQDLNALISATAAQQIVLTGAAGINDHCEIVAYGRAKANPHPAKVFVLTLTDPSLCVNGM
jgi:uncharacterized membrane protein